VLPKKYDELHGVAITNFFDLVTKKVYMCNEGNLSIFLYNFI